MLYFFFIFFKSSYASFSSIISCCILKKKKKCLYPFSLLGIPFSPFLFFSILHSTRAFFFFAVRFNPLSFLHGILCNLYRFSLYLTLFFFSNFAPQNFYTLHLFHIFWRIEEFVGETIFSILWYLWWFD